jgi:hypothetical protein
MRNHHIGGTFAKTATQAVGDSLDIIGEAKNATMQLNAAATQLRPLAPRGVSETDLKEALDSHSNTSAIGWTPRVAYSQSIGSVPHYAGFIPQERFIIGTTFGTSSLQASRQLRHGQFSRSSPTRPYAQGLSPTFKGDLIGYETARRIQLTDA